MPGDPKNCRLHAMHCAELARDAKAPELKNTLLNLSKTWMKLAQELERTNALLDEADPPPSEYPNGCRSCEREGERSGRLDPGAVPVPGDF